MCYNHTFILLHSLSHDGIAQQMVKLGGRKHMSDKTSETVLLQALVL